MVRIGLWAILLVLGGCAASNQTVDQARLNAIENGKTTRTEVEAVLGKPTLVSTLLDGRLFVTYIVRVHNPQAQSEPQTRFISMRYDSAGVVHDLEKSETKSLFNVSAGPGPNPGSGQIEDATQPKRKPFVWPENTTPNR